MGVFNRLGGKQQVPHSKPSKESQQHKKVCVHWRAGRCTRNPCPYLHKELTTPQRKPNPNFTSKWVRDREEIKPKPKPTPTLTKVLANDKVCNYWKQGKCIYGDKCKYLHQWFKSDSFTMLTQLPGHEKVITGIALPSASDKLYSSSKDKTMKAWDCNTGKCTGTLDLGEEVGCMKSEGPWIFVGMPNLVRAWNTETNEDISLATSGGQVYAFEISSDMLFAGMQDGSIITWKFDQESNCIGSSTTLLKGHNNSVVSLIVGGPRLYSGSLDCTVKSWDLKTLQCVDTLTDHRGVVTSVLCWSDYLISSSLDQTIKVWGGNENGRLELVYTHKEDHGVLSLCGISDAEDKPLLMCSINNNTINLYDLPSFKPRGKIFSKEEVLAIQIGPGGLFFTGDGAGELRVWKYLKQHLLKVLVVYFNHEEWSFLFPFSRSGINCNIYFPVRGIVQSKL